jgi:hypothetical protein
MNPRQDFEEATALELLLLQTILEAGEPRSKDSIDLTDPSGTITHNHIVEIATSGTDVIALKTKLLSLAFGAGWKIVDLIIEYEVRLTGPSSSPSRIPFIHKKNYALSRRITGSSLGCEQQTWECLLDLYAATVEHRHCLVHRKVQLDRETGTLNGLDSDTNNALVPLTVNEQLAFANCAVLAARSILDGGISQRNEAFLKFYLNQLSNHSKASQISGASAPRALGVRIPLERDDRGWFLDLGMQLAKVDPSQLTDYYDITIVHPSKPALRLESESESMPPDKVYVDLESPPPWLHIG